MAKSEKKQPKIVFVVGGVLSSLGKGIIASSLGCLLKQRNLNIAIQKLDPYLNIDPGTMSPYEHGEVFVTEDGAETDLDLGHYERFIHTDLSKNSNITSGAIYSSILKKEREGKFLGKTIQIIPHVTNEIKTFVYSLLKKQDLDVLIVEIGGTIGDIELLPFIEAARQISLEKTFNVCFIMVTLVPFLKATNELKTKPTQSAIHELGRLGIQPQIIVCRTEKELSKEIKAKIANFCNVTQESVFESKDVDTIYRLPKLLKDQKFDEIVCKKLNLNLKKINFNKWNKFLQKYDNSLLSKKNVKIKIVGKYVVLPDAYLSIIEALKHACTHLQARLEIDWINSEELNEQNVATHLKNASAIIVPGGFGERGIQGKIIAIKFARLNNIPFLGICLGMQLALVEIANNLLKWPNAHSTEMNPNTEKAIIDILRGKSVNDEKGGTLRLGKYNCEIKKDTLAFRLYKSTNVIERHRHRYEVNNAFINNFEEHGVIFSGINPEMNLKEIIELKNHPFFIACQFHPEYKSRPYSPHPLFLGLIESSIKHKIYKSIV